MSALLVAVAVVEVVVCTAVAVVLAARWRQQRTTATASAVGVFATVALVVVGGFWEPADTTRGWPAVYVDALICLLLLLPYLLVRFTWALGALDGRVHRAAAVLYVLQVVATVAAPPLPAEGAAHPHWFSAYMAFVLVAWSLQSLAAAVGLWRAGRGESAVVRHRMRALASGAVLLAVTLVLSGTAGGEPGAVATAVSLLGLSSILLFALAFLSPRWLRLVWRQKDLAALSQAERGLMAATTREAVADTIVPVLASVLGGGAAALLDVHRVPVRTSGLIPQDWAHLADGIDVSDCQGRVQDVRPGVLATGMQDGWLVVQAGRLAPVFGDDETVLLGRVATLVDLALQRVRLFERERQSRQAAETASADLETLLYSVSHDLRSPLISVLGYLDVLRAEHAAELQGDGPHYLERISVNAVYMQHLIADLLELSRIGRGDGPVESLDLDAVARQVVDGARLAYPRATVAVSGTLPGVRMTDVRARQLLTNLVDNALKHGGRDDLRVMVSATEGPDGSLVLHVADDGVGVPAEYRDRVLRVFERLDSPKSSPGTGMGLAICKRICESLGGSLSLGGPPPGAATGTTVSVVLPASVRTCPVPAPRGAATPATHEELV